MGNTILLALSVLFSGLSLVLLLTVISALITSPENRANTLDAHKSNNGTNILTALKIWIWEKQDNFVGYLKIKESGLDNRGKKRYLIVFILIGVALSLSSLFWHYEKDTKPFIKTSSASKSKLNHSMEKLSPDSVIMINEDDVQALKKLKEFTKTDTLNEKDIPKIW